MGDPNRDDDKGTRAIGGGVLMGIGVGFFFLHQSPLFFVGSILAGLGFGLLVTSVMSAMKRGE
jgi:hypothetical protein